MKLQNRVFFNEYFTPAFRVLLEFDLDAPITSRLIKSVKAIDEQQYAVFITRDKLIAELAEKTEDGTPKLSGGNVTFETTEARQKFEEQFEDLLRDEFDIPLKEKIKLTKVHKINGNYLSALEDIVEVIDDGGN